MPRLTIYVSEAEKEAFDKVARLEGKYPSHLAKEWHINKLKREHKKLFNRVIEELSSDKHE